MTEVEPGIWEIVYEDVEAYDNYNVKFACNVNPTSRSDWNAICTEYAALTGGLGMWFEIVLPGDTDGYFFRGEPVPMAMPDFNAGEVVQGEFQIIESDNDGWQTKATA